MTEKSFLKVMQQLLMPVENKGFRTFRKTQDYRIIVSLRFECQGWGRGEGRSKKRKRISKVQKM